MDFDLPKSIKDEARCMLSYMHDKIRDAVNTDQNKYCHVIYSAYSINKNKIPINNLNEVAIKGTYLFSQKYDIFWDATMEKTDAKGTDYLSESITDPTWLQIAVLANDAIITTHDYQHLFLEGLTHTKQYDIIQFNMGS